MVKWYWWLVFAAVVALTVFVMKKASDSSKKRQAEQEKIKARLRHEAELKRDFEVLTEEKIMNCDEARLFEGAAANIQFHLEKFEDMEAEFEKLSQPQKYVYTCFYLVEDALDEAGEGLYEFFLRNGKPLTPIAEDAVRAITGNEKLAAVVAKAYAMSDDDNEDVSVTDEEKRALNLEFSDEVFTKCVNCGAEYIRKNAESFIGL